MKIEIDLPTAVEGGWRLLDEQGNEVAASTQLGGAKLVIEPFFYEGLGQQNIGRLTAKGDGGVVIKQLLRVTATTGKTSSHDVDKDRKRVKPVFDKKQPKDTGKP